MEQKSKQGGVRKGAGRKPVLSKKKQVSLYVEGGKILNFGSEDKMKSALYLFIDKYVDGVNYENPITERNGTPITDNPIFKYPLDLKECTDEPLSFDKLREQITEPTKVKLRRSYENYQQLKIDCQTVEEWVSLKAEILSADHIPMKQRLFLTA